MSQAIRALERQAKSSLIARAILSGEFVPLNTYLRAAGKSRMYFYRHPEIRQVRVGGRVYVAAVELPGGAK